MQLVEIVAGVMTSQDTLDAAVAFAERIGKTPVRVVEAPGFVVNRLLVPMINEAILMVSEGVASAEGVDSAMRLGANHPLGPLALADLIGLDVCLAIMETLHREFGEDKYRPCPALSKMVRAGLLGRKSGQGFYKY
jgi:3-hydroxybutyryl-CoA dehydrogenase